MNNDRRCTLKILSTPNAIQVTVTAEQMDFIYVHAERAVNPQPFSTQEHRPTVFIIRIVNTLGRNELLYYNIIMHDGGRRYIIDILAGAGIRET